MHCLNASARCPQHRAAAPHSCSSSRLRAAFSRAPSFHATICQHASAFSRRHRSATAAATAGGGASASSSALWTPGDPADLGPMASTALKLRALCDALPELPDDLHGALAARVPGALDAPPAETRARLDALAAALGVPLLMAARLVTRAPLLWNRSPEAAAARVHALGDELGVDAADAAALLCAAPSLASVSVPGVARDRVERLSAALRVSDADAARMVGRQPMLWAVPPGDVRCGGVPGVAARLGVERAEAVSLIERMPVLLALDESWLQLSIPGLAATSGLPRAALLDLVVRHVALATLPADALGAGLDATAAALGSAIGVDDVLNVVARQPTLLVAQPAAVSVALEVLCTALRLEPPAALAALVREPALLFDTTREGLTDRLASLAALLQLPPDEARALALEQPSLLVANPSTLRAAVSRLSGGLGRSAAQAAALLRADAGAALALGLGGAGAEEWAARLQLGAPAVAALFRAQPGLLEMAPSTLKARLESLAALFEAPTAVAAQLLLKHPALAAVPPNATITRAKNLSTALKCSMAKAGQLIARAPAALVVAPAALAVDGADERLLDVAAAYEFYTRQWLERAAKERAPARAASFSGLHGGRGSGGAGGGGA